MDNIVGGIKTLRSKPLDQNHVHKLCQDQVYCIRPMRRWRFCLMQLPYLHSCSACFMVRHGSSSGYMAGLAKKRREEAEAARREARRKQVNVLRSYRTGKGGGKGRGGVQ